MIVSVTANGIGVIVSVTVNGVGVIETKGVGVVDDTKGVFAVLGGGRVLAGGGFSSGWLGIDVRGWCWWEFSCLLGVWLIGC